MCVCVSMCVWEKSCLTFLNVHTSIDSAFVTHFCPFSPSLSPLSLSPSLFSLTPLSLPHSLSVSVTCDQCVISLRDKAEGGMCVLSNGGLLQA